MPPNPTSPRSAHARNIKHVTQSWGDWVRTQLARRNWSNAEAAKASGLPPSAISQWITSQHQKPSMANLRKLAEALDVPILTALVAAGYITAAEAGEPPTVPGAADLTTQELLDEVKKRMRHNHNDDSPVDTQCDTPQSPPWPLRHHQAPGTGKFVDEPTQAHADDVENSDARAKRRTRRAH